MAASKSVRQRGAREVSRPELDKIPVPPATATWYPIGHGRVLETALRTLAQAGFEVTRTQLALIRSDARFFATLDLRCPLASGVTMALGIRNSTDKSLPIAFCAGSRTIACENLAFSSEIIIASKHTRFGEARFSEAISGAVQSLHQFREAEAARIQRWQQRELSVDTADALLLRAYEKQVITTPLLPCVIREWRQPSFEEFRPRTLWSLFNAFTTVLARRQRSNPQRFAALTIRLHDLLTGVGDGQQATTA
jgi:hypothetical protein